MRKIIAGLFQSIDGVVQAPGSANEDTSGGFDNGGWVMPHFDETVGGFMHEVFSQPFDLLLGRRTYDIFAAHWPRVKDDPMADAINAATKFVVTHQSGPFDWQNTRHLSGLDQIPEVKKSDGPDLLIQGSSTLYPGLVERDLIDRLFLITFPIVMGSGKRAFDGAAPKGLRLVEHRVSGSGVMIGVYELAGELPRLDVPSPS
ncbi:putative pyrimidine reductase protein [Fulvimarina pelagi HTCC2506]|uniref:Putative pyrimidine reductase protein n=1 Tax=Fulvimarina pelagi HTCC2506 TaxID=314231 RepID=Q0G642_9HYPH|nr:dihydrofolate reductase family protein [Fulvimarina pelagi]EAU42872.1 putative pyrimidine reductase protein [Fulvimarina pelagi HTCC2506]